MKDVLHQSLHASSQSPGSFFPCVLAFPCMHKHACVRSRPSPAHLGAAMPSARRNSASSASASTVAVPGTAHSAGPGAPPCRSPCNGSAESCPRAALSMSPLPDTWPRAPWSLWLLAAELSLTWLATWAVAVGPAPVAAKLTCLAGSCRRGRATWYPSTSPSLLLARSMRATASAVSGEEAASSASCSRLRAAAVAAASKAL